jgi:transcriptional regulator with XRE-family HTH domain
MLSMHRPTITEIEMGRRKVSAEELSRFAETYRVDVRWLLDGEAEVITDEIEVAARELARLKPKDRAKVIALLRSLHRSGGVSQ